MIIHPRSTWTAVPAPADLEIRIGSVKRLVVHHSAAARDQTVEEIRAYHVRPKVMPVGWKGPWPGAGKGFRDIGYHYVIRRGVAYHARPLEAIGAHSPAANRDSLGILVTGNYLDHLPAPEDRRALLQVLATCLDRYPGVTIHGHGEVQEGRSCPGRLLEGIREELPERPFGRAHGVRSLL